MRITRSAGAGIAAASLLGFVLSAAAGLAPVSQVSVAGGVLQDDNTFAAVYVNAQNQSGQVSITTGADHFWGFVFAADYSKAGEADVFASDFYTGAVLEVNVVNGQVGVWGEGLNVSLRRLFGRAFIR